MQLSCCFLSPVRMQGLCHPFAQPVIIFSEPDPAKSEGEGRAVPRYTRSETKGQVLSTSLLISVRKMRHAASITATLLESKVS